MFKFIKEAKDLSAANVEIETIQRAEKRFTGVKAMVFGWVVQSIDTGKILWAVAEIPNGPAGSKQFGMVCMNEGKPLVYVNVRDLIFYVPELANSMISFDTTSVSLGLSGGKVVGQAYTTISVVSKATRLFNEGRAREAMAMNPPVVVITPEQASNADYIDVVSKARRDNAILVLTAEIQEDKAKRIGYYAESELMVESVRMVMC